MTVVDALNFLNDFQSLDALPDRGLGLDEADDRDLSLLLADQIEFANVILLNKIDLVSEAERERIHSMLRSMNPEAEIVESCRGQVPLDAILNTGRFSDAWASGNASWLTTPRAEIAPETEEYGSQVSCSVPDGPFIPSACGPFSSKPIWPSRSFAARALYGWPAAFQKRANGRTRDE